MKQNIEQMQFALGSSSFLCHLGDKWLNDIVLIQASVDAYENHFVFVQTRSHDLYYWIEDGTGGVSRMVRALPVRGRMVQIGVDDSGLLFIVVVRGGLLYVVRQQRMNHQVFEAVTASNDVDLNQNRCDFGVFPAVMKSDWETGVVQADAVIKRIVYQGKMYMVVLGRDGVGQLLVIDENCVMYTETLQELGCVKSLDLVVSQRGIVVYGIDSSTSSVVIMTKLCPGSEWAIMPVVLYAKSQYKIVLAGSLHETSDILNAKLLDVKRSFGMPVVQNNNNGLWGALAGLA